MSAYSRLFLSSQCLLNACLFLVSFHMLSTSVKCLSLYYGLFFVCSLYLSMSIYYFFILRSVHLVCFLLLQMSVKCLYAKVCSSCLSPLTTNVCLTDCLPFIFSLLPSAINVLILRSVPALFSCYQSLLTVSYLVCTRTLVCSSSFAFLSYQCLLNACL